MIELLVIMDHQKISDFDYRLAYWENTKLPHENVQAIIYEKIFFDGDKDEAQKLFDALDVTVENVDKFLELRSIH